MIACAFTITETPNRQVEIQCSGDIATGTELEKRLANCITVAVGAAMEEVLRKYQSGIVVEKDAIAAKARAACKMAMGQ